MAKKLKDIDRIQFQDNLLKWFRKNKRNLPWREQKDWYPVFLSEIMLQQTQVEQALPYYNKFINRFPDIHALGKASEQEVLSLWAGLGYYSRARNMLKAAKLIVSDYNAQFPKDFKHALSLSGIGKYSASAILSIAYKKPYAVVDGNVYRVISRLFVISDDLRLNDTQKKIQQISDHLLSKNDPGDYNEAMMELGAVICKKQNPDCTHCPIQSFCEAFKTNQQLSYPYKSAARKKHKLNNYVFILERNDKYLIVQRPSAGLLASLWEFPVTNVKKLNLNIKDVETLLWKEYNIKGKFIVKGDCFRHQYSHIDLTYQPVLMKSNNEKIGNLKNYVNKKWIIYSDLNKLPIHNAHLKLIDWLKNLNQ
ncbi:MAG: A/G-specific adenine glycosylase [Calditrichaceae bacterium]